MALKNTAIPQLESRASATGRSLLPLAFVLLITATVFGIQIVSGAYGSDLASHADEAAHFTTGVMVFDYLTKGFASNPLAFAESYYVRYPKVAFGHWPPVFYLIQAFWYLIFGPTTSSARMLAGSITSLTAICLFRRLNKAFGTYTAILSTAVFLTAPLVFRHSSLLLSDMLVTLFSLLAIFAFSDFLRSQARSKLLLFTAYAVLAILTKGSAWSLGFFAILAPLIARKPACFRNRDFWIAGAVIVLIAAPFFVLTLNTPFGYAVPSGGVRRSMYHLANNLSFLPPLLQAVSPAAFAVALLGCFRLLFPRRRNRDADVTPVESAAALALLGSQCFFLALLPLTRETRFFLPSVAALAFLFAQGLSDLQTLARPRSPSASIFGSLALALVAIGTCGAHLPRFVTGYRAAANSIPTGAHSPIVLVSSNALGEGAFVADWLVHDRSRSGVVLRASKTLADTSWDGELFHLWYTSPASVRQFLNETPVTYVVLDVSVQRDDSTRPYQKLLRDAVSQSPGNFVLLGRYPIHRGTVEPASNVLVYRNLLADDRRPSVIRLNLGTEHGGRTLELRHP